MLPAPPVTVRPALRSARLLGTGLVLASGLLLLASSSFRTWPALTLLPVPTDYLVPTEYVLSDFVTISLITSTFPTKALGLYLACLTL